MRTLRLSLVGPVILVLLAGLGSVVVAQDDEGGAVWVTLMDEQCSAPDDAVFTSGDEDGKAWLRDYPLDCTVTWSDPRISGTRTTVYNDDCLGDAPCVYWGTHELAGPDGTWSGSSNGTTDPDGNATGYTVLIGSGGYDGLTFLAHAMGPFGEPPSGFGIIYEGDAPPMP